MAGFDGFDSRWTDMCSIPDADIFEKRFKNGRRKLMETSADPSRDMVHDAEHRRKENSEIGAACAPAHQKQIPGASRC